jgi:hypothetical protein
VNAGETTDVTTAIKPTDPPGRRAHSETIANAIASALVTGPPLADRESEASGAVAADADENAPIPTSAGGFFVAAVTFMLVTTACLCAVHAYQPALDPSRAAMAAPSNGAQALLATGRHAEVDSGETAVEPHSSPAVEPHSSPAVEPQSSPAVEPHSSPEDLSEVDAGSGHIVLPAAAEGHRIYVDGRITGGPTSGISVPCGPHILKVGSRGRKQNVLVPCRGNVFVSYP